MDELELRIGAIETLLTEYFALRPAPEVQALIAAIREGLPAMNDDETAMRAGAAQIAEDGLRRHDGFEGGVLIQPKR